MKRDAITVYALGMLVVAGLAGQEAKKTQFTARELFYSAADAPTAPAQKTASSKSTSKKKPPTQVASTPKASSSAPASSAPAPPASLSASTVPLPNGAQVIRAAAVTAPAPTEGPALGLRYTILKRSGGQMMEVAPDTVFHADDRMQFNIETNGAGYLYIVTQGSSGTWRLMFPSPEIEDGNNHVEGFHTYTMPPKSRWVFDTQSGTEKIFIVLSRQPEPDLENLIYSLQAPKSPQPTAQPQPAQQPKKLLMASLQDDMVGRLRNTYARDLIIEKTDDTTPGDKKEKAVYVVNPTGSQDSRVVADLSLVHQ